jgi:L-alanine-DL-glutamate epimerase-like enolase superfamily enzyme
MVTRHSRIPVLVDESCLTSKDIPPLVGRVDGINIKLAKCGSIREAMKMIAIARAHHLMVMVGCMIESSIGITAMAQVTPLVDLCDLDGAALLAKDPYLGATMDRGQVRLPGGPGLGLSAR